MLRKLRIKNFYSIYEPLEISLMLSGKACDDHRVIETLDSKVASKLLALIGANGSGKTNILKSLAFLQWFVFHSFTRLEPKDKIPVTAHFIGKDEPTEFHIEFEYQKQIWRYDLILTKERILHEALYRKNIRFMYLFKRDWQEQTQEYKLRIKDEFEFSSTQAKKVRQNCSLISAAAQYNEQLAVELSKINMTCNLTAFGRYNLGAFDQVLSAAELFYAEEKARKTMQKLLQSWDLGLSNISIEKRESTNDKGETRTLYLPFGVHKADGKEFDLLMFNESSGTQSAFTLLSKIIPILEQGGLAVIDEIEADLHPHMLAELIDLFISPETNPHQAQLIFSTHSHELINTLRKEQILLVEKDNTLNTDAYRLNDIEGVRTDDNFYAKYMAGAYGAIPEL